MLLTPIPCPSYRSRSTRSRVLRPIKQALNWARSSWRSERVSPTPCPGRRQWTTVPSVQTADGAWPGTCPGPRHIPPLRPPRGGVRMDPQRDVFERVADIKALIGPPGHDTAPFRCGVKRIGGGRSAAASTRKAPEEPGLFHGSPRGARRVQLKVNRWRVRPAPGLHPWGERRSVVWRTRSRAASKPLGPRPCYHKPC